MINKKQLTELIQKTFAEQCNQKLSFNNKKNKMNEEDSNTSKAMVYGQIADVLNTAVEKNLIDRQTFLRLDQFLKKELEILD